MDFYIPNELIKIIASNLDNITHLLTFSICCKKYYSLLWNNEFRLNIMKKSVLQFKKLKINKISETGELIESTTTLYYCLKCGDINHVKELLVGTCYNCLSIYCIKDIYREIPCQSNFNTLCINCIKYKGNYIEKERNTTITKEMYNNISDPQKVNFFKLMYIHDHK